MLTKEKLMALRQCPRRLWLEHHQPQLAVSDAADKQLRFRYGRMAGERARAALGSDVVWPTADDDLAVRSANTRHLMQQHPNHAGVETPFIRDQLYCRADAVVRSNGHYKIQETKTSTFRLKKDKITPEQPKPHYVDDAAVQLWAAQGSGLPVPEVELNLVNNQFVYHGDNNYDGLFRALDVTQEAQTLLSAVPKWIEQAEQVLNGGQPACTTGTQCNEPYPCPFAAYCKSLEPAPAQHPLTLLPDSAGKKLAKKLSDEGFVSLLEVPADRLSGAASELYLRMQSAHAAGAAILKPEAAEILSAHAYPRYFLDFEGINFPVPRWAGMRPYQQVAFQWSCHVERQPGVFEHFDFLDLSGDDPSLPCLEKLLGTIAPDGPIYVYHATYEVGQLQAFASRYPQYSETLTALIARVVDLLPLVKDHYYDPAMQGSFSLKQVLPCIAPELSYSDLEEVQQGVDAQNAYLDIILDASMSEDDKEQRRKNMLAYCRQDTQAMVEVAYFLEQRGRPQL